MKEAERRAMLERLQALPPEHPRILLATGKLIGEGFDHAPLDTLILAIPISWKGTLQPYVGRLHREHDGKTDILVIDFIDRSHPSLLRMWNKRQAGYPSGLLHTSLNTTHLRIIYAWCYQISSQQHTHIFYK